jgi:hypothetical protein
MELAIKTLLAGILFGIWPLLLNRSGMTGTVSTLVFTSVVFAITLVTALSSDTSSLYTGNLQIVILAGVCGAIALLSFNSVLAKATRQQVPSLFLTMILVQISVPVVYDFLVNHEFHPTKIAGILAAVLAAILLA